METSAVFELPVPVWVMTDALDSTYSTGYGELRFSVVTPQDRPPISGPPSGLGVISQPELFATEVVWAQEYAAFIPGSLQPATALHRLGVKNVVGPSYDHKPWFTPRHQLAEYIHRWFDAVRTWVEIVTGQDLDPHHRIYDAEFVGSGLTFLEPPCDTDMGVTITTPHVRPLRAYECSDILGFVREGQEPPLEEVLSRDARAAQKRNANRRAIIDAATALEIVLGRHVRAVADELPETQRGRINDRSALGDYISIVEHSQLSLAVPIERLRLVNRLRNGAAHRGEVPTIWDAGEAVQVMIDFLGAYGRFQRSVEPDSVDGGVGAS